jgi:hypothetical protein
VRIFLCLIITLVTITPAMGADNPPEYEIRRTTEKIVIDGILDDADWISATSAGPFSFPWIADGTPEQTEVKMLWDDEFLYISYRCDDAHIWADHYDTNADTYRDDTVELFWNPNPAAGKAYNMFEVNCLGNLLSVYNDFDVSIHERARRIMPPHIAQTIRGTVNDDSDTDEGWTLEIAIRFSDYPELYGKNSPTPGERWHAGLNRIGGKTNPQHSQWSPSQTDKPSFHRPDDFGILIFTADPAR